MFWGKTPRSGVAVTFSLKLVDILSCLILKDIEHNVQGLDVSVSFTDSSFAGVGVLEMFGTVSCRTPIREELASESYLIISPH